MQHVNWDIRRKGRAWDDGEAEDRRQLTPEKFEMMDGRLFFDDEQRLLLLGLLLENVGADATVRRIVEQHRVYFEEKWDEHLRKQGPGGPA